ncbi:MAG TPA: hypothetical protein VM888_02755 [Chitinophagaceae bacterium]|nr:hypothetical protein [Chitinophagaceae bacterium]
MKQSNIDKAVFSDVRLNNEKLKPSSTANTEPANVDRKNPDPSSVVRSERYPIPSFFEYRIKQRDNDQVQEG